MDRILLLQLVLAVLAVWSFRRQLHHIRTESSAGVSPTAWFGLAGTQWAWVAYATVVDDYTLLLPALAGTAAVAVCIAWARSIGRPWRALWLLAVAATIVTLWAVAPHQLGTVAGAVDVAVIWPQVLRALRAEDVSGISVSSWTSRALLLLPWTVYGAAAGILPVALSSGVKLVACVLVATITVRRTRADSLDGSW